MPLGLTVWMTPRGRGVGADRLDRAHRLRVGVGDLVVAGVEQVIEVGLVELRGVRAGRREAVRAARSSR